MGPAETASTPRRLPDGRPVSLRALTADDVDAVLELLRAEDPEDLRLRFFRAGATFTREDMDAVLPRKGGAFGVFLPDGALAAIGTLHVAPPGREGEFAVLVASPLKGLGIGALLLRRLVEAAREAGLSRLHGDVLRENLRMRALAAELGFTAITHPSQDLALRVSRDLDRTD